jgi:hypothetical protein
LANDLTKAFNDPANRKFRKIWAREANIVEEFELGCNWFQKWSNDRDAYAAKGDAQREKFCAELVDFWDRYLVKAAGHLAKHKHHVEDGKDSLSASFTKAQLTTLQPLYDVLAPLDENQRASGMAIFAALQPLMLQETKQASPAQKPPSP